MAQKFTQTIRQPRVTFSQLSPETLTRGRAVYTTERVTNQKVKNNIDKEMVVAMEYRHIINLKKHIPTWGKYFTNYLGRLTQGVGTRVASTNTIFLMQHE